VFETRKWSYYDVVTAYHRKKIHKLVKKLSKSTAGSPEYLGQYHKAHNEVEKNLTDDQCQEYKVMAKEWLEKKLPQWMQQQYIHGNDSSRLEQSDFLCTSMMAKNGPRAIKEFTRSAYNQFGMCVVILAAFVDNEGDPSITLYVQCSIYVCFS
jgi:hypothetical protein